MAQSKITYEDKENNIPIVIRKKQVAAEDLNEIKSVVNSNVDYVTLISPMRINITSSITVVNISGLTGSDYEIEIIAYTTTGGSYGNGTSVVDIPSNDKNQNSFNVVVPDQFNSGVLIYRILNFNN